LTAFPEARFRFSPLPAHTVKVSFSFLTVGECFPSVPVSVSPSPPPFSVKLCGFTPPPRPIRCDPKSASFMCCSPHPDPFFDTSFLVHCPVLTGEVLPFFLYWSMSATFPRTFCSFSCGYLRLSLKGRPSSSRRRAFFYVSRLFFLRKCIQSRLFSFPPDALSCFLWCLFFSPPPHRTHLT